MIWAARDNANEEIVRILLEYDADIDAKDNYGKTVFNFNDVSPKDAQAYFTDNRDRINTLLAEKMRETIATAQRILRDETNSDYIEEILIHMDYQQARHIVIKHKKQTQLSSSPTLPSASNKSDEDFKQNTQGEKVYPSTKVRRA